MSSTVVCTTTGELSRMQQLWFVALHTGGPSVIGGITAAGLHGLRGWDRDAITVLVDDERVFEPVAGVDIVRTRRPLIDFRDPASDLPLCQLEPAVLLYAGYTRSRRTAIGLLAACVQQRLTTPDRLLDNGHVLVLEVDGAFHMEVAHWEDELARHRALTTAGRMVVRATAREVRDEAGQLAHDLIRLGVRGRVPGAAG